jgi:hypothetical protein
MDNFDYKKFIYEGSLTKNNDTKQTLNENAPGYDTRKFGESLPTLESVKAAHEAKQKEGDVKENMYIDDDEFEMEMVMDRVKEIKPLFAKFKYPDQVLIDFVRTHRQDIRPFNEKTPKGAEAIMDEFEEFFGVNYDLPEAKEIKEEKTISEGALGALFGAFTLFYLWKKGELKFGGAKIEDVEEYSDLPDELQQKVSNDEFEKIKDNTDLI